MLARRRGWLVGAVVAALASGCPESHDAGLGEACATHGDCIASAQCFGEICAPRCTSHVECGGGYTCRDDGICERIVSQIGDACAREIDCGPRQSCQLDDADDDGDGHLAATCQADFAGAVTGASCAADTDCRSGLCALGQCSEVCSEQADCPGELACVEMPRLLADAAPLFHGCLRARGRLELELPVDDPHASLRIPVPGNARSFALVTAVADPRHWIGATRVQAPSGALLYRTPTTEDEYYANALRYAPGRQTSTLLLPNAPHVPIELGVYTIDIASLHYNGGASTQVPTAHVIYHLDDDAQPSTTGTLDLDLYFLDLADHPCGAAFPAGLDAATAATAPQVEQYLTALDEILAGADIRLGAVGYHDIVDRPELDAIDRDELGALLAESTTASGVNVFFVRSIQPVGVQALAGGTPGTPGIAGTPASGIAVGVDTLCYRGWDALARTTAHTLARQLGLFRNVEPDGREDPIADSDASVDNLLHFSEFAGTLLSPGQGSVLRANPVVQ